MGWLRSRRRSRDLRPSPEGPTCLAPDATSALRRAARNDGWIGVNYDYDDLVPLIAKLTEERKRAGTDHKPFEIFATLNELPDADTVKRLRDVGVTAYNNPPWLFNGIVTSDLATKRATLEEFAEKLIRPING